MLCTCGLIRERSDKERLFLPEAMLLEGLRAVPEKAHTIVVAHHPLDWLNETSRETATTIIAQSAQAYLSGHLHRVDPQTLHSLAGTCFFAQSGALYDHRDRWNGYGIYQVVPGSPHVKMNYRRWFERRRQFGKAEDLTPDGVAYSSQEARAFFAGVRTSLDYQRLDEWRKSTLLPAVEAECGQSLSPVPIETSFVDPEFTRDVLITSEVSSLAPKKENVTFEQAISAQGNLLISAPKQSGKTTALRQWAFRLARDPSSQGHWTIPALIDFKTFREYPAYIETRVSRKFPGLPEGVGSKILLQSGAVCVIVDDVDFENQTSLKALGDFMAMYPACRYVLASASALVDSSAWEPVIAPELPLTHIRLRPLRRKHLLSLIRSHGVDDPNQADQLLERVTREARALNVPLTAVTSSLLIQVFSSEPDRVLVNQATLIERYVELLLQKFTRPDIELKSFDFKLKRDLLAVIAEQMDREDEYNPLQNTVLEWVIKYVEHYGFPQAADQIVQHLIGCRILEKSDSPEGVRLHFTLAAFESYFAAFRMIESKEFRDWVMDSDRYLTHSDTVSFYAALARNDRAVLDTVFSEFARLTTSMWEDASPEVKDGTFMDDYVEPNPEASVEEVFAIQDVVKSKSEIDIERGDLQDTEAGPLVTTQQMNRPDYKSVGERWFAHLALVSLVLRHMELIPDAEKRKLLKQALTGWLQFCTLSLSLVPIIARDKKLVFNGVTYRLNLQTDIPIGELARRLSLVMPLATSSVATNYIGSEKLKLQLMEGIGGAKDSASTQLFRALLLADIGVDEIGEVFTRAEKGIRGHRFLLSVLVRKLYDVAIRFRVDDANLEEIREIASRIAVSLEGKKGGELEAGRRNQIKKALREQRVVSKLGDTILL